jgi:predicted esterase
MKHATIAVPRTAHYYRLGEPSANIRRLWLVCHGYAQLADEFLENFRLLDDGTALVVAPEGMNYFYRKGFGGPVGATWMTRRHREDAIRDYSLFLQTLHRRYLAVLPDDVETVALGFSQGAATVCRWMFAERPPLRHLVLWGGLPPEDLDYTALGNYLKDKTLHFLMGDADPFVTPEREALFQEIKMRGGLDFQERRFAGGHEVLPEVLAGLRSNFSEV